MKKIFIILFVISVITFNCTKKPDNPLGGTLPSVSGWYIIDSANDSISYVHPSDYSVSVNVLPNADSAVMSDILIQQNYAFAAGGYSSWSGEGSHDIRKLDLRTGYIVSIIDIGAGRTIPSGGIYLDLNFYAVSYNDNGEGKLHILDSDLKNSEEITIGGKPQSVIAENGTVYIANIDSYSYNTNWIDILLSGSTVSSRFILTNSGQTNKDPVSLTLNDTGDTLYVLCAGTWGGDNGYIAVITNVPNAPAFKTNLALGFNAYGKIKYHNGDIYFTGNNNLYKMTETALSPQPVSAVSGKSVDDIDFDDLYIYITGGWGTDESFILKQSDDSLYKTITVNGGMGALYQ